MPSLPSSPATFTDIPMQPVKRTSLLLILAILTLVSMIGLSIYLNIAKASLAQQDQQLSSEVSALKAELNNFQKENVEATQFSKKYLEEIEAKEIRWSGVLKGIQDLTPVDSSNKQQIRFLSYSGIADGKVSLNAETVPVPSVQTQWDAIAKLLDTFNSSSFFKDASVASVTRGLAANGDVILTFNFNVTYNEQTPDVSSKDQEESAVSQDETENNTSSKPKVPRN